MHTLAASAVLAGGLFDTIPGNLPVHPLIVHFAVVLLPLSALALVGIVVVRKWRGTFGWVTLAGLAIGAVAAFVAKESGEQLADRVGLPQEHAELGDLLPPLAVLLFIVAVVWFLLQRRAANGAGSSILVTVLGIVAAALALGTTWLTIQVGHSGATAVWAGEIQSETASSDGDGEAAPAPSTAATGATAAPGASAAAGFTLADVQAHSTPADCWTVVNGTVYDVTDWITRHPGGPGVIKAMCGTDATSSFQDQHKGQGEPNQELASFEVGPLAG